MDEPTDKHNYTANSKLGESIYIKTQKRNDSGSFANLSPFVIKKTIDYVCNGEVDSC